MNTHLETLIADMRGWLSEQRARRYIARTRRLLETLPNDIQKDIGWPNDSFARPPFRSVEPKRGAEAFLAQTECSGV